MIRLDTNCRGIIVSPGLTIRANGSRSLPHSFEIQVARSPSAARRHPFSSTHALLLMETFGNKMLKLLPVLMAFF